ncbi:MAG: CBS domain-containing protein [Lentisphaeria bacterium]|nr:CBS domain-containing protein [Lentisphaeria bacterium]
MAQFHERQIRLVHELMYQIKVREAMTRSVVTFAPSATFREIQRCLKERQFSGTPIVEDGRLVGMVSIDDIISAFDTGSIDQPVATTMTRDLVTVPQNYSVIAASNLFQKYRFGRLPVVRRPGSDELVGIITFSDILTHLLLQINSIAERVEEQERSMAAEISLRQDSLHFDLAADNFARAGVAASLTKKRLKQLGVSPILMRRIAVICYEAEMNVILHSLGGVMDVHISQDRVRVVVSDEGPGIPDLERAMEPGFTTANEKIRALGFGAGMGLPNIKRCADEFRITSSMERGTELEAVVYLASSPGPDPGTPAAERHNGGA